MNKITPEPWMKIGARVVYHPIVGRVSSHDRVTTIRSAPWQLGSGDWVIKVDGVSGGVAINAIESLNPSGSYTKPMPGVLKYTQKVTIDGVDLSLKDACKKMGWNYATVTRKLRAGMSLDEATTFKPVGCPPKYMVDLDNGERISLRQACTELNIDYPRARVRFLQGLPWRD